MRGHRWRGAAVFRSGGLPPPSFGPFVRQSPGRSRIATRPIRGAAEACVSRALAASALSLAILLSVILALASGCALRVDLDLTGLQRLRRRKEPLQLKRCRALSSAHDNTSFATEHCTNTMARSLLLLACATTALVPTSRQQHKRSVMRMGWGDPPVCEPRPRSDFCARCTPSTRRPPHGVRRRHRRSGPRPRSKVTKKPAPATARSSSKCPPRPRKPSRRPASTSN